MRKIQKIVFIFGVWFLLAIGVTGILFAQSTWNCGWSDTVQGTTCICRNGRVYSPAYQNTYGDCPGCRGCGWSGMMEGTRVVCIRGRGYSFAFSRSYHDCPYCDRSDYDFDGFYLYGPRYW